MTVRQLLNSLLDRAAARPEPNPYRAPAPASAVQTIRDVEAQLAAQAIRIRVLERQLAADGRRACSTPTMHELRAVVGVLDSLARLEQPRLSIRELRALADSMRGLATWGLGEP